jgi:hypothetical protein
MYKQTIVGEYYKEKAEISLMGFWMKSINDNKNCARKSWSQTAAIFPYM